MLSVRRHAYVAVVLSYICDTTVCEENGVGKQDLAAFYHLLLSIGRVGNEVLDEHEERHVFSFVELFIALLVHHKGLSFTDLGFAHWASF